MVKVGRGSVRVSAAARLLGSIESGAYQWISGGSLPRHAPILRMIWPAPAPPPTRGWNDSGEPVVYCAPAIAMAVLETVAHIEDAGLPLNRFLIRIDIPDGVWAHREELPHDKLPQAWAAIPAGRASIKVGSDWLSSRRSTILLVPSVIVPEDWTALINPRHSDASAISAVEFRRFDYHRVFRARKSIGTTSKWSFINRLVCRCDWIRLRTVGPSTCSPDYGQSTCSAFAPGMHLTNEGKRTMSQQGETAESQIKDLIEAWADAVRRHDISGILAHHEQDIVMFDVPPPLQSRGMDEYKKTWDLFFRYHKPSQTFDIEELGITAGEDVAFAVAIMRCGSATFSGPPD
jgi:ketosteroid isomerase-like protein/RES domain-containing protein